MHKQEIEHVLWKKSCKTRLQWWSLLYFYMLWNVLSFIFFHSDFFVFAYLAMPFLCTFIRRVFFAFKKNVFVHIIFNKLYLTLTFQTFWLQKICSRKNQMTRLHACMDSNSYLSKNGVFSVQFLSNTTVIQSFSYKTTMFVQSWDSNVILVL